MREYAALMPFVGGCRETAPQSFALLAEALDPERWHGALFIDGFFGGGAIGLTAKKGRFRVVANDLAARSAVAAQAILLNHAPVEPLEQIVAQLLLPVSTDVPTENVEPWLQPAVAEWVFRAFENANLAAYEASLSPEGVILARYLAALLCLSCKPGMYWSRLTAKTTEAQREKVGTEPDDVAALLLRRAKAVVSGIFDSGQEHEVHQVDAIALLKERGGEALVCSLDPPTYGQNVYDRNYFVLDAFLDGSAWHGPIAPPKGGVWKKQDAVGFYCSLLEAAQSVPFWLVRDDAVLFGKGELAEWLRDGWGRDVMHREAVRSTGTSQLIVAAAEPIEPTGKTWVVPASRRSAEPPRTKAEAIRRHMPYLARQELFALCSFSRQPDWETVEPLLVRVRGERMLGVWTYWRFLISSEPQKPSITGVGRWAPWMVLDRKSGTLLGIFALTDDNASMAVRDQTVGWTKQQAEAEIHRVVFLARCLPTQPFGQLLGGKLLAMLAGSAEVIRDWELTYSYTVMALSVRTLHGEASQYGGLAQFRFLGTDDQGRGHYLTELRKKGLRALRGEVEPDKTRNAKRTVEQVIREWRERWYWPRLARVRTGEVPVRLSIDPQEYALARWRI